MTAMQTFAYWIGTTVSPNDKHHDGMPNGLDVDMLLMAATSMYRFSSFLLHLHVACHHHLLTIPIASRT
jgi:hypothetical protein